MIKVKTANVVYREGINAILEAQLIFYEHLFTSEGWDNDSAETLLHNVAFGIERQIFLLTRNNL